MFNFDSVKSLAYINLAIWFGDRFLPVQAFEYLFKALRFSITKGEA